SAQIREILISESAWEEMTCLFAPSLKSRCIALVAILIRFIVIVSVLVILISVPELSQDVPSGLYLTYKVITPGVKELIVDMAFNGVGVHDTARTLEMGLKSLRQKSNTRPGSSICKADKQWSFLGSKKRQTWL
ncbi:IS1-like element transposase, partial [Raoultella ornithinolytica]|uniref:IS1-like element transposase n=1 Tax=Raoultella ornithinolytica TaxID=54291 RepID=UPI00374E00D0